MRNSLAVALGAALIVSAGGPDASAQGGGARLQVSRSESGFTIAAQETTLPEVLTALGRQAGFSVQDSAAERTTIPVFEVRDSPLESTLRRLLASSNHLIVYRGGSQRRIEEGNIAKIVLLSPGTPAPATKSAVSPLAGPGATAPTPRPQGRPGRFAAPPPSEFEPQGELTQTQGAYDETPPETEYDPIEQLDVDPEVASAEPGVNPSMPPGAPYGAKAAGEAEEGPLHPEVLLPSD